MTFKRHSRYFKQSAQVGRSVSGRLIQTTPLRIAPDVSGQFEHVVEDGDRLDHIAYKYYREPRRWWRICDANPDYPSPLDLVGKSALVTVRIPLLVVPENGYIVRQRLHDLTGVESVSIEEETRLLPLNPAVEGHQTEQTTYAVRVVYNSAATTIEALVAVLLDVLDDGLAVGQPETMQHTGTRLIVPPR